MPLEYAFACQLPHGVHARPASALEDVARRFAADISILNERTGRYTNAKSVLGIIGIDVRMGDRCRVTAAGADEQLAMEALRRFLVEEFPSCDDVLPMQQSSSAQLRLPPVLRQSPVEFRPGTPVVPGIGQGRAVRIGTFAVPNSIPMDGAADVAAETRLLDAALDRLARDYESRLDKQFPGVEADVLKAHYSVARDPEFRRQLEVAVQERRRTAAGAISETENHFTEMLVATGSLLLRERALDIRDVCMQLLRLIYGEQAAGQTIQLDADSVCLADALTPGQFLLLDRRYLKGLVLAHGGTTSHTVILARSFGVPTLVGVDDLDLDGLDRHEVIVDADLGMLVTRISDSVRRYYDMEYRRLQSRQARLTRCADLPALTRDGRRIEVAGNISSAAEALSAWAAGAEGIGLFRTEMLFTGSGQAPTENEQYEQYRQVLVTASGRPVVIRTLDIGGDKPLPYLSLHREENPFLGYRAVRIYPAHEALFRDQLRALLRASALGPLKIMIPMICCLEEAQWVRKVIAEEQAHLTSVGVAFDGSVQVGAMVEVPAMAFLLRCMCDILDFFSIGTNDLLQYFLAVDRANDRVGHLYNPVNPAFLRLLKKIVDESHLQGKWVGLCGEMGGRIACLPLLVGLGLDEISMAAPGIVEAKAELAFLETAECGALVDRAMNCSTNREVEELLADFVNRPAPLIDPELVLLEGEGLSKEEAIKEVVDRLYVVGRTDRPREVEEAVWQREAAYSTGFGYGCAIPHCKTHALRANSLAVLRLKDPVEWGSLDEKPVQLVVLLAIRESDQATEHMKVLSKLARCLMHEEFRNRLAQEPDAESLCRFIIESV